MLDGTMEYSSSASECRGYNLNTTTKRKRSKNKRRFSDEQIRSLEVMFESETKLEPRKKVQLAKDLGLQPRQVAIWFQNKRARWKSKHIEKEYTKLLANYNNLASQFESLKKEKHSLLIQLQKLKNQEMMGKSDEKGNMDDRCCQVQELAAGKSSSRTTDGESNYANKIDFKVRNNNVNNNIIRATSCLDNQGMLSNDDSCIKGEALLEGLEEEAELLKMADSSLTTSAEDWGSLDSDGLMYDQPTDQSLNQWWDFWC